MPLFRLTGIFNLRRGPDSFRLLPDNNNHNGRQFAADKYHAWCGNLPVADFNPQTAVTIGNGYFTDGKNTVFCAPYTRINNELTGLQKLYQEWRYGWGLSDKPLSYYYPQQPLPPSASPYRILPDSGLVSNGEQVFFDGKLMPEANPKHCVLWESGRMINQCVRAGYFITTGNMFIISTIYYR